MKLKVIDITSIADVALDRYCADIMSKVSTPSEHKAIYRNASIRASVMKMFESVFDEVVNECAEYDKVVFVIPCFPMLRVKNTTALITRFICKNSGFFRGYGISTNQFLDYFEKFLALKSKNGDKTDISKKVVVVKNKFMLGKELIELIKTEFGCSIVDSSIPTVLQTAPGYITNIENSGTEFTEANVSVMYNMRKVISTLLS